MNLLIKNLTDRDLKFRLTFFITMLDPLEVDAPLEERQPGGIF